MSEAQLDAPEEKKKVWAARINDKLDSMIPLMKIRDNDTQGRPRSAPASCDPAK